MDSFDLHEVIKFLEEAEQPLAQLLLAMEDIENLERETGYGTSLFEDVARTERRDFAKGLQRERRRLLGILQGLERCEAFSTPPEGEPTFWPAYGT